VVKSEASPSLTVGRVYVERDITFHAAGGYLYLVLRVFIAVPAGKPLAATIHPLGFSRHVTMLLPSGSIVKTARKRCFLERHLDKVGLELKKSAFLFSRRLILLEDDVRIH